MKGNKYCGRYKATDAPFRGTHAITDSFLLFSSKEKRRISRYKEEEEEQEEEEEEQEEEQEGKREKEKETSGGL